MPSLLKYSVCTTWYNPHIISCHLTDVVTYGRWYRRLTDMTWLPWIPMWYEIRYGTGMAVICLLKSAMQGVGVFLFHLSNVLSCWLLIESSHDFSPLGRLIQDGSLTAGGEIRVEWSWHRNFGPWDTIPPHVVENKKYTTLYHPLLDVSIPVSM